MNTTTFAFLFSAGMVIFGAASVATLWRLRQDRPLADILDQAIGPVLIIGMFGAALYGFVVHADGLPIFGIAVLICLGLFVAAKVAAALDRRADKRRRAQLGLAQHRRFVPPTVIGIGAGLLAYLATLLLSFVAFMIFVEVTNDRSIMDGGRLSNQSQIAVLASFLGFAGISALIVRWLVRRQQRKIAADRDRVAELDRQTVTDDPTAA